MYLPGKSNHAADAASRYPNTYVHVTGSDIHSGDHCEAHLNMILCDEVLTNAAISWSVLAKETDKDPVLCNLRRAIYDSFAGEYNM